MTLNKDDIRELKIFCQFVIDNPLSFDEQDVIQNNGFIWCRDWEVIELCKYLFNGHDFYMADPPPNRLKNNPLWNKDDIVQTGQTILREFNSVDSIINHLKERRYRRYASRE